MGSMTPRRCASVSGTRSGLKAVGGVMVTSLTVPLLSTIRISSSLWSAVTLEA